MKNISDNDVRRRLAVENPWWDAAEEVPVIRGLSPRDYFNGFFPLVRATIPRRAVVLLGPRRVGKTVMIFHTIKKLLADGVPARNICYFSIDHPIYNGLDLENLLKAYKEATALDWENNPVYVFFDEIQYLKDWERYLKILVDGYELLKITVSGSAAAALKLKSMESGAGRFTEFMLPPLTFPEYLNMTGRGGLVEESEGGAPLFFRTKDITALNDSFIEYVNYGGYPEVALIPDVKSDPGRFIKADIIDKVLLRDLPSLYGIQDVQELNSLFTSLAYNAADEVSYEEISKNSGVSKNTIKRYLEYLSAAFLIKIVQRVDINAKRFKRANYFKIYLSNPSMRCALFAPVGESDDQMGAMAENAVFSQWFHGDVARIHYARWADGEVDLVHLSPQYKPVWAGEIKWTDRYYHRPNDLKSLLRFCLNNNIPEAVVTTKTEVGTKTTQNVSLQFVPVSLYCYTVGYHIVKSKTSTRLNINFENIFKASGADEIELSAKK